MRIGVDLGGTSIRAGLADKGTLLRKERLRCPSKGSCGEVLDAIEEVISRVMHPDVESVGIGVPSVVDTARGIVYNAANIPSWKEVPLKDIMQERLGLEVNVNNDSNCFTLGESLFGKCRDCSDIVGLTIGTGVGSGIMINGRLYEGRNAGAGEIGSLPYLGKDFESWCGLLSSLQTGRQVQRPQKQPLPETPGPLHCGTNTESILANLSRQFCIFTTRKP